MTWMKAVFALALIGSLTALAPVSAAQDATAEATPEATATTITLVPFTDVSYGIEAVAPEGWQTTSAGIRARASSPQDVALIAQQVAPGSAESVMNALLPQLSLTAVPPVVGERQTEAAGWKLYQVDVSLGSNVIRVDMALAQAGNSTYIVLVQSLAAEYEVFHEQLFLPALDAFRLAPPTPEPTAYHSEDVTFDNGDVTLAGTLTLPNGDGPFAAVVLVSGSGPQNRDEVLGGGVQIAPFALIADTLTRAGIAVLRYDDRGVAGSSGDFASAATQDFASDATAAIAYLATRSEIDAEQIGLLGHSEGGLVGAILGASDAQLAFAILMAGPAVDGRTLLDLQNRRIMETAGATEQQIADQLEFLHKVYVLVESGEIDKINTLIYEQALAQVKDLTPEQLSAIGDVKVYARRVADQQTPAFEGPWFKAFLDYDPGPDLEKIKAPVLALFGGKDVQVDAGQNAPAMTARLADGGNRDFSVVVLPDANHLFQKATTGAPSEYASLPPEFTPDFLPTVVDWLSRHVTLAQGA